MSRSNRFVFPDNVTLIDEAENDFMNLDRSMQIPVFKAICKVAENPKPRPEGYGKPLSGNLAGFNKIKLRDYGIRVIYTLVPLDSYNMKIVIIGFRDEEKVYREAERRIDL